jgi:hypothetical protein
MWHNRAASVSGALSNFLHRIIGDHKLEDSRNGPVMVAPGPVVTEYIYPMNRVLFSPKRDANPFFHLMEALWMLGGRQDVAFVEYFNKNIRQYSDDGEKFYGAYGWRWRNHFERDQLAKIARMLKHDPTTRRAVLGMWDPMTDLEVAWRDVPCNTTVYFDVRYGRLNMTVCNRSNDALWGCYGANAVHFSFLQEYIAALVQVPVGTYYQFSNNLHIYLDKITTPADLTDLAMDLDITDEYKRGISTHPLMSVGYKLWHEDLQLFLDDPRGVRLYHDPFFDNVVSPMYIAWKSRKEGDIQMCRSYLEAIKAQDWRVACEEWVARRESAAVDPVTASSGHPRAPASAVLSHPEASHSHVTPGACRVVAAPLPNVPPEAYQQGDKGHGDE